MNLADDIFAYGLSDYKQLFAAWGEPTFRAHQLAKWLWVEGVNSYDEMSNLPTALRKRLAEEVPLARGQIERVQTSDDGTRKYLIAFGDGIAVEAVGLPETGKNKRLTVCVSSQAGCALACVFCATGRGGLVRNLLPGEMLEQVRLVGADFGRRVSNIVLMGQGEPFLNYSAVMAALGLMTDTRLQNLGSRRITISTAGVLRGIERLTDEPEQYTLAVSLHSALQTTRDELMPGMRGQKLDALREVLIRYTEVTHRRASLEYALIAGVNDTPEELAALGEFARTVRAHVNLLPLNEAGAEGTLAGSTPAQARSVATRLRAGGVEASVRARRGADIAAACGQLKQT